MTANIAFIHIIKFKIIFSVVLKYPISFFFSGFNKFNNINPRKGCTRDKEANVHNNASKLYMKVSANLL